MANQPARSKREMGTQELKKKVLELQATVQRHTEEIKELQSKLKSHDEQFRGCKCELLYIYACVILYLTRQCLKTLHRSGEVCSCLWKL